MLRILRPQKSDPQDMPDGKKSRTAASSDLNAVAKAKAKPSEKTDVIDVYSEKGFRDLVVAVAKLGLQTHLEQKTCKTIAITPLRVTATLNLEVKSKKNKKAYVVHLESLDSKEREKYTAIHVVVYELVLETAAELIKADSAGDFALDFPDFHSFLEDLEACDEEGRSQFLTSTVRFARIRQAYGGKNHIIEVAPTIGSRGEKVWKEVVDAYEKYASGVTLKGIAPRGRQERRIEAALKAMGEWN